MMPKEDSRALDEIKSDVSSFILKEFLPGEDPAALEDTTPLIQNGILDSISNMRLVDYLESKYGISLGPNEVTVDRLSTVNAIARTVESKLKQRSDA